MKKLLTAAAVACLAAAAVLGGAATATATPNHHDTGHTLVAWVIPDQTKGDNEQRQTLHGTVAATTVDRGAFTYQCGTRYQLDLYRNVADNGDKLADLLAPGYLDPNHDGGFLAYDLAPTPYLVFTTDPCPPVGPTPTPTPTTTPVTGAPVLTITPNNCPPNDVGEKIVTWDIPEGLAIGGVTGKGSAVDEAATILNASTGGTQRPRSWILPITVLDGFSYDGPATITLTQSTDAPNGDPTKCTEPTPTPTPTTPTPEPTGSPSDEPSETPTSTPSATPPATVEPSPTDGPSEPSSSPSSGTTAPAGSPLPPKNSDGSRQPHATATDASSTTELAYTGASFVWQITAAAALLLAGIALLVFGPIRRHYARR